MRITLITQKPNTARGVAQHSLEHVVCWLTGFYVPALPKGLHWKGYPFTASFEEHKFKRRSEMGLPP